MYLRDPSLSTHPCFVCFPPFLLKKSYKTPSLSHDFNLDDMLMSHRLVVKCIYLSRGKSDTEQSNECLNSASCLKNKNGDFHLRIQEMLWFDLTSTLYC